MYSADTDEMPHYAAFIWVFTVCQSIRFWVSGLQRVTKSFLIVYSTKTVKEISENHGIKKHQKKQVFSFHLFV